VGGGLDHLELGDGGVAEAGDLGKTLRRSGDGFGERAELGDEGLASGLMSRRGRARNSTSSSSS
jgi:hypothetical protein